MATSPATANPYDKFKQVMRCMTTLQLLEVESLCSMTFEEIVDYFLITTTPTAKEKEIIELAMRRGRAKAIKRATEKLFSNMQDPKQGTVSCLAYLKRFSKEFEKEVDNPGEGGSGISYNVTIAAPKEPSDTHSAHSKASGKLVSIK